MCTSNTGVVILLQKNTDTYKYFIVDAILHEFTVKKLQRILNNRKYNK